MARPLAKNKWSLNYDACYDWANKKGLSVATDKPHDSPQTGDHPDELSKGNDTSGATGCATPIPRGNK